MSVYFSKSMMGFIPAEWKEDGTYDERSWPSDSILLSDDEEVEFWKKNPPNGKSLGVNDIGKPCWIDVPEPELTYAQELTALNAIYAADRLDLCQSWLIAAVADGVTETERKADVEAELAELDAQHAADIAELKTKYGVS